VAFPRRSVDDTFVSMICQIDDERAKFTRSLAWRGPSPLALLRAPRLLTFCLGALYNF
jgi:hypothetical protein